MPTGKIPFGPTYDEMANPHLIDAAVRQRALAALTTDELDPINLFNITWKNAENQVRKLVFPREVTGLDVNIIVLLGQGFPSGSHKVGPAYATLIEACVDGKLDLGRHTILGPSTGNFGIGVAYVCKLMRCRAVVIMPDNMSKERYDRIRRYGGELELTPGTESDVILTLQRTHELMRNPSNFALAQFELLPNYRFHRHVTGSAAVEAAADVGNGRVAAFVSAPGSAGTLAAGDHVKSVFPDAKVVAVEPYECSTLSTGGRGQHRIEGIGDKMCTLIHNVLTTDFVITVHDDHCVQALKIMRDGADILTRLGVAPEAAELMRDAFGVSGMANVIAAVRMARYLRLGPDENVVTVATDGFDRYNSVVADLEARYLEVSDSVLTRWASDIFATQHNSDVHDIRKPDAKQRLFAQKERDWLPFGYTRRYLDSMKSMAFWEDEYAKHSYYTTMIAGLR
jgi:cysteine synthase A